MRAPEPAAPLRQRLLARVQRSARVAQAMHTQRLRDTVVQVLSPGVQQRRLYSAADGPAPRPGEPLRVSLVELAPGAAWTGPGSGRHREWLLLQGQALLGAQILHAQDYLALPTGAPQPALRSSSGALLLLRESALVGDACTSLAADALWTPYAPRIERRLLWQQQGQAAMLYRTAAGAAVPCHRHRHDEECLMLAGELFLDDVLLRTLDYQLAPAGSMHDSVLAETPVLLYAHGDADLDLIPAPG
jgi:hypothetical protein